MTVRWYALPRRHILREDHEILRATVPLVDLEDERCCQCGKRRRGRSPHPMFTVTWPKHKRRRRILNGSDVLGLRGNGQRSGHQDGGSDNLAAEHVEHGLHNQRRSDRETDTVTIWCSSRIISAARSPMITQGAMVLPVVTRGMIDPSAMRRLSTPYTFRSASTTHISCRPILAVDV